MWCTCGTINLITMNMERIRCRSMMSACTMVLMGLLFLLLALQNCEATVIVGCPIFRYMSNGTCHKCPDNCRLCVSDTNCTLCQKGFYGPVCENRCGEGCTGTCHKLFGHCTHGCPDGEYPDGNGCRLCPLKCSLCESQSKCVLCEASHFGEDCQERCPKHCTICNKPTGQCLQCKDTYFRLNKQCKSCPYGCRFCNTTDNCQSCKNGFHGPVDGRCLYKCPSYGIIRYHVPYEDGRCGIWQNTDSKICHLQTESHSCTSSGNCIQAIGCPYSVRCMDGQYERTSCAAVMQYACKHKCKQLISTYGCEATCTLHARGNTRYNLLCMTDTNYIDLHSFENTTKANCSQEQGSEKDGIDNSSTNHGTAIILVIVSVCVVACFIVVFLFYRKRCSANASIKREPALKVTSTTEVVQSDLPSQILFQDDTTTDPLVINIHDTEGLTVEEIVDGRDVNKTEDDISDTDPDIEVKAGTDTDAESDISDLDYDTKHEIKPTDTQRDGSAHYKSMLSVTTPAPHKYPKSHKTRTSNPYQKPTYKDKSGKEHAQCRTQDTIWKQVYMPISPEEQCAVKCSELFGRAYNDQVERFTA